VQKILQIDLMIDARDKQLASFPFAQEGDAAIEAQTAAGQHDDGIGSLSAVLDQGCRCKPDQTSNPQAAKSNPGNR
jgi:hypothetical protein